MTPAENRDSSPHDTTGQTATRLGMQAVLIHALSWIDQNLSDFDPYPDAHEPNRFGETPLAELSLLYMCLRRSLILLPLEAINNLASFLCSSWQ